MKKSILAVFCGMVASASLSAITIFSNDFNVADTTDASFLNHFKAPGYPTDGRPTNQFFTLYNSSNSYDGVNPATAINYTAGAGTGFSHSIVNNALVMNRTGSPRAGAKILEFGDVLGAGMAMPQNELFVLEASVKFAGGAGNVAGTSRNNGLILMMGNNFGFSHGQAAYTDVDDGNPPVGDAFASVAFLWNASASSFAFAPTTVAANTTYNFANPTTYFTNFVDITWVMNNTGSAMTYVDPNGNISNIANDTWDFWAGTTLLQDDVAALIGANLDINSFQLFYTPSGTTGTTLTWDSLSIYTVPEPRVYALVAGLLALGYVAYRRRR